MSSWSTPTLAGLPGLVARWDASTIVGKNAGDAISQWNDLVGTQHAVQATGSAQPVYSLTGGLAGVTFDGVNDLLAATLAAPLTHPMTAFVVCRTGKGTVVRETVLASDGAGGTTMTIKGFVTGGWAVASGSFTTVGGGAKTSDAQLVTVELPAGSQDSRIGTNGIDHGAGTTATATINTVYFGSDQGAGDWLKGTVHEVLLISGILPPAKRRAAAKLLRNKWSIPDPLARPVRRSTNQNKVGIGVRFRQETPTDRTNFAARIYAGGLRWVRTDFRWSDVEATQGTFDWTTPDACVAALAGAGLNIMPILTYTPAWARVAPGTDDKYPPTDPTKFAAFCTAAAQRYGPGGAFWSANPTVTYLPIRTWEIWNEPWLYLFWKPNPDATAFAALALAACNALHAADPGCKVGVAMDLYQKNSSSVETTWMAAVNAAQPALAAACDAYVIHAYPSTRNESPLNDQSPKHGFARTIFARDDAAWYGMPAKPVWITEFGWSSDGVATTEALTEAAQADAVERAVHRALTEWGSFVERIFVFEYSAATTADWDGGLRFLRANGTEKPVVQRIFDLAAGT